MDKKKKIKAISFRKMKDDITRVDAQTFYHKSETNPNQEPYMVFHSQNPNNPEWTCDCTDYWIHIEDNGQYKLCKHILKIKKQYNL